MSGKSVEAKVISHKKDDKIIVFKKKRRKGYKVKNGHRQSITEIIIQGISEKKASQKKEVEILLTESNEAEAIKLFSNTFLFSILFMIVSLFTFRKKIWSIF